MNICIGRTIFIISIISLTSNSVGGGCSTELEAGVHQHEDMRSYGSNISVTQHFPMGSHSREVFYKKNAKWENPYPHRHKREQDDEADKVQEVEDDLPYFDASMSHTYTAYLGKMSTLTCIVHAAKSDKSVSWIRGRDLRILTVGRYTYTTDLRFEALHQPGSSEWTMRIKSVQPRDQGTYECQITTKPIRTFSVFLKVVEPSVEVLGAPDIYVNRASMINLTCVVHHAPVPPKEITWYHGKEIISYTSPRGGVSVVEERGETTTSFLLLQNAQASDSGPFTCLPHGMDPVVFTLHVLDGEKPAELYTNASCGGVQQLEVLIVFFCMAAARFL